VVPDNMDALEWLRKHLDAEGSDLLREMVRTFAERLMAAEVDVLRNAGFGEVTPERINSRNGHRSRQLDTRVGTIDLAIPKVREGSYYPGWLLEPRRWAERALVAVVAEASIRPTRRGVHRSISWRSTCWRGRATTPASPRWARRRSEPCGEVTPVRASAPRGSRWPASPWTRSSGAQNDPVEQPHPAMQLSGCPQPARQARKFLDVAELVADGDIQASHSVAAAWRSSPASPPRTRPAVPSSAGDHGHRITTTPSSSSARSSQAVPRRPQLSDACWT
jgi:hypothetical protein